MVNLESLFSPGTRGVGEESEAKLRDARLDCLRDGAGDPGEAGAGRIPIKDERFEPAMEDRKSEEAIELRF